MKKIILVLFLVTSPAWCDGPCRVYDYQEMKDMTDQELTAEINRTEKEAVYKLTYSTDMMKLNNMYESRKARAQVDQCLEQNSRLEKIKQKRAENKKNESQ